MTHSSKTHRSPLRAAALAALALGALAASGCLKFEQKATIQKDGSGSLLQTISIDVDAFKKIQEFAKAFNGGTPGGEPAKPGKEEGDEGLLPFNLEEIQEKAKQVPGLQIRNAKTERRVIMDFEAVFADWSTLGQARMFPGSAELAKNADGTYTFTLDMMAGQKFGGGEPGADSGGMGMDPQMIAAMLEPMLGSLEFRQSLTLPGSIVETNGTKSEDGMTVSWKVGFKDLMGGKGANLMKVTFKGDGLEIKPFKYMPDMKDVMDRVQGKSPKRGAVTTPSTPTEPAMDTAPAMDTPKEPAMDGPPK